MSEGALCKVYYKLFIARLRQHIHTSRSASNPVLKQLQSRTQSLLSAPAAGTVGAFFASAAAAVAEPISTGTFAHPRAARCVSGARQKVEPRRGRARVAASASAAGRLLVMVVVVIAAGAPRVRRWRKLRPVERQRRR